MPPTRYTLLHPDAQLLSGERREIYAWSKAERRLLLGQTSLKFPPPQNGEHSHRGGVLRAVT